MSTPGSVTNWILLLRQGDHDAAQPLWERYFSRLMNLARNKLGGRATVVADAEDVALSVLDSLCRGLEQGRFPQLDDRHDLWRLLVVITARKAAHLLRDERAQKRSPPRDDRGATWSEVPVEEALALEPTPELAAQVAEELERLLASLNRTDLRTVAVLKMEGYTNREISERLGCAPRTVDRKLSLIRRLWENEASS